jgi:hypothetical protein
MEFTREDYLEYCAMLGWDPSDPVSLEKWEEHCYLAYEEYMYENNINADTDWQIGE